LIKGIKGKCPPLDPGPAPERTRSGEMKHTFKKIKILPEMEKMAGRKPNAANI
jgi:hypothetical protein